jgi:DNA-binding NarL/FixJ family response regulator
VLEHKAGPIQVLLVDDNPLMMQGLRSLLQSYSNIEVVGEAINGEDAVLKAGMLQPAVIVMDINMPKLDGIAATRLIKVNYPHIAVLGLTVNAQGSLDAMLKAGAFEVLCKDQTVDELYGAIQRAGIPIRPIQISTKVPVKLEESTNPGSMNVL